MSFSDLYALLMPLVQDSDSLHQLQPPDEDHGKERVWSRYKNEIWKSGVHVFQLNFLQILGNVYIVDTEVNSNKEIQILSKILNHAWIQFKLFPTVLFNITEFSVRVTF